MKTIVNITGLTLKCLETSDENDIKKAKKREYHKQWYLKNKEHKKQYDIKYRKEIYNKIVYNQAHSLFSSWENKNMSVYVEYFNYINKNGLPESYDSNFDKKMKAGEIIEKKNFTISVTIYYGKIIIKKLNYAWYNSIPWGVGFFSLVFPGFYLISLLIRAFKSTKHWIVEHSNK